MQTTPEATALLAELYERSALLVDLDGPQIEAWVSGLFAAFDDHVGPADLVRYCTEQADVVAALVCQALAELTRGIDDRVSALAEKAASGVDVELPAGSAQIGMSVVAGAWTVQAPFGRSVVWGFDNPVDSGSEESEFVPADVRHSILAEIDDDQHLVDLQLAGPPQSLVDEAALNDDRVIVTEIDPGDAAAMIIASWPTDQPLPAGSAVGPGLESNQQFVRRRIVQEAGVVLPFVTVERSTIDIRRGLEDSEYVDSNRAARSTLRSAVGLSDDDASAVTVDHETWVGVIRGDGGDLSERERDALLWLEWADWLGVGIGLLRAGAGATCSGESFVDYVNRCPEVSSTIDKADRDYAEWAFDIVIDMLTDQGLVVDGTLTQRGHETLGPAMVAAWSDV